MRRVLLLATCVAVLAGCGGDDEPSETSAAPPGTRALPQAQPPDTRRAPSPPATEPEPDGASGADGGDGKEDGGGGHGDRAPADPLLSRLDGQAAALDRAITRVLAGDRGALRRIVPMRAAIAEVVADVRAKGARSPAGELLLVAATEAGYGARSAALPRLVAARAKIARARKQLAKELAH